MGPRGPTRVIRLGSKHFQGLGNTKSRLWPQRRKYFCRKKKTSKPKLGDTRRVEQGPDWPQEQKQRKQNRQTWGWGRAREQEKVFVWERMGWKGT